MTSRWTAIVLAAGQGTRMRSRLPKVAHPIAGRTIVRHVIEAAREAGADECVVVVPPGDTGEAVRAACGDGVRFAVQDEPRGTGHAVLAARPLASDAGNILIMNGDVPLVLPETLRRLMAAIHAGGGADMAADLAVLTACVPVESYGILELVGQRIVRIVETKGGEGFDRAAAAYINSGQYAVAAAWLWSRLERIEPAASGERYLTELASMAHDEGRPAIAVEAAEPVEVQGINDRVQLATAEAALRQRILRGHMLAGVTVVDPSSTFIDSTVRIDSDTRIEPNTYVRGMSEIGQDCVIGPGASIDDSRVGDRCVVRLSVVEESTLECDVDVGPYSHLRPGSYLCEGVHIGNFAEVKGSRLGRRTKMGHFSYIGDAEVGEDVNVGAGTITANFDGQSKNRTVIGDGAFIGSDTMLVAPVRVGAGARTSAGAVVTRDVPDGMTAIGAPARIRSAGAGGQSEEGEPGR